MTGRKLGILLAAVAVTGLGYYLSFLIIQTTSPYTPIADIVNGPTKFEGKTVQVLGLVKSIDQNEKTLILDDGTSSISVVIGAQSPFPQGLGEGKEVWVQGRVVNAEIVVTEIRVECPSK